MPPRSQNREGELLRHQPTITCSEDLAGTRQQTLDQETGSSAVIFRGAERLLSDAL